MATEPVPPASATPATDMVFDGPSAFAAQVRRVLAQAAGEGWPTLVFSDPDFADWPLGERAVIESLQAWASAGRQLQMVAGSFEWVQRQHPRFVTWRRLWDHIVECRVVAGPGAASVPSGLWTPACFVHRIDPLRSRGVAGVDAASRVALRHAINECFRQGRPGFAASVAGL